MNISRLARTVERTITENAPLILTSLGVVGVAGTAFFTGKAAYKSAHAIADAKLEKSHGIVVVGPVELTKREVFDKVWKLYMPAVGVATLTCVCIVMANRISAKRAAALAAGVVLSRNELAEYKEKVEKKLGKKETKELEKDIIRDRVDACMAGTDDDDYTIRTGEGEVLFLESYTMRPFRSSIQAVEKAENRIVQQIHREGYATIADWFDKLGLEHTVLSEEMGWDADHPFQIEMLPQKVKEGPRKDEPCHYLAFENEPLLRPWNGDDRFPGR